MLAIEITLNPLILAAICFAFFAAGYFLRSHQLNKLRKKIIELEKEMLSNHADILGLQRQKAQLEEKIKESRIPVIPLKTKEESKSGRTAEGKTQQ